MLVQRIHPCPLIPHPTPLLPLRTQVAKQIKRASKYDAEQMAAQAKKERDVAAKAIEEGQDVDEAIAACVK